MRIEELLAEYKASAADVCSAVKTALKR